MNYSRKSALALGLLLMAVVAVACGSTSSPEDSANVSDSANGVLQDNAPASESVLMSGSARPIPDELLLNPLPDAAIQVTVWNEFFLNGTLRSLDGNHSLEFCTRAEFGNFEGDATGSLGFGIEWAGRTMLENTAVGWKNVGLIIHSAENGASEIVRGYLLQIRDGVPTLVWNPDATLGFGPASLVDWQDAEVDNVPFEVLDGADCRPELQKTTATATPLSVDSRELSADIVSALRLALEDEFEVGMQLESETDCRLRGDFCSLSYAFTLASNPLNSYLDEPIEEIQSAVESFDGEMYKWNNFGHGQGTDIQNGEFYRFVVLFKQATIGGYLVEGTINLIDGELNGELDIYVGGQTVVSGPTKGG